MQIIVIYISKLCQRHIRKTWMKSSLGLIDNVWFFASTLPVLVSHFYNATWNKVSWYSKNYNLLLWVPLSSMWIFFKDLFILCIRVHCSCTYGCEPSCGCWVLNLGPLLALVNLAHSVCTHSGPKIIYYKYTVAVFRHNKRGRQISLQVVVSHHVVAGIWTQDLQKSSQCSYTLSHLASPSRLNS